MLSNKVQTQYDRPSQIATNKIELKESPDNLNGHCTIPIGQGVLPEDEVTERQKAFSNHVI